MAIDDFKSTKPLFLPERFFVGRVEGWAVLESLVGGLLKRASITGHGEFESCCNSNKINDLPSKIGTGVQAKSISYGSGF